ncbi:MULTISPECIES: hypothetical protein [Rhodomicrobium]|uniref:hypothetical protein n=1 Tax=Rhodomicrobium TaxID=1068 RepID=UPI000B4BFD7C|nr:MULTISPECIES: hypothetical protein [Rhodomicrobium]
MDNDEKLTSRHEDTLPGDDADAKTTPEDGAGDIPMPPYEAAEEVSERANNTISFPKPPHVSAAARIEANFGMPDFDFPEPPRSAPPEDLRSGAGISMSADDEPPAVEPSAPRNGLDMPLGEDTGWDSVDRIERPAPLRARAERPEPAYEPAPPPPHRAEANVMPFPGAAMPRATVAADPAPSDMLRGMSDGGRGELFAGRAEELPEPQPDFDNGGGDALADAVQSALRNVYGGQPVDRGEDPEPGPGGYTVAESLMHASSADRVNPDPSWSESPTAWSQQQQQEPEQNEDYYESEREEPAGEASTEAVLDYLYGQRRADRGRPSAGLSADSSLRDFGEAAGYSQQWQDGPDYDDRAVGGGHGALRDFGDAPYRGGQPRYADPGDSIFLRDPDSSYRGDPSDDAEWAQVPYLSHPGAASGQIYPTALPSGATEGSLSAGSPDSGHLLGAAGLGLIGGIALAGVLAVFVFNSFVDENDPNNLGGSQKVVERLSAPPADTAPALQPQPAAQITVPRQAVIQPEAAPAPVVTPRPVPQPAPAAQRLSAQNASGVAGDSISLDIRVADSPDRDETLVSLKGLPSAAKLSTGIDVGGGQWLLPPARLRDLTVALPRGAAGEYDLEVQLLQDDAQTSLSDPVPFQLKVNDRTQQTGPSGTATRSTPVSVGANSGEAARLAVLPDETPQIETDFVTQMLIRDGNRLMRDGDIAQARKLYEQAAATGNAEAALAMGRSFDPSYFEKLQVKSGKPDPATAFEWYKKALEGGLVTARVKIDALKQWLQR